MKSVLNAISLKVLLNLLITALLMLVMLLGAYLLLQNARENVRAEIESTAVLVTHMLDAEIAYLAATIEYHPMDRPFSLEDFRHIRHFRIEYFDAKGKLRDSNYHGDPHSGAMKTPEWFTRKMQKVDFGWQGTRRHVIINGRDFGHLVITPDPSYEIAEVWDDTEGLLMLVAIFFLTVNVMVYWAVDRALRPIDNVWSALDELEQGNLDARLPSFRLPELARISDKFNRMANTLQQSITRNHKLAQQLIHLQEEERKSLARDLHDELGQSLTAISVDGTALLEMSRNEFPRARDSAQAIVDITQHVITQIRVMLQRLRPEVLDGLGLREALNEMIAAWQQRHPGVTCTVDLGNDIDSADDTANITSYRVVQECLTNISRHAEAHNVGIVVRRGIRLNMGMLEIMVSDDGKGFDMDNHQGFGLTGMRERVEGMGGGFKLASTRGSGTHIFVSIPLREAS